MLQDSILHSHSRILHYAHTQLDMSECTFKLNSSNTLFWESQITNQTSILTVDCRILKTVENLQTYDVCQGNYLQWICTGSLS